MRKNIALILAIAVVCTLFGSFGVFADVYEVLEYSLENEEVTITNCFDVITEIPEMIDGYPVTNIAPSAFSNKPYISSITIPKSVKSIGRGAFASCTNLAEVVICADITTIEESTFYNCTSLTKIVVPKSVNSINNAFNGYYTLETVEYEGSEDEWRSIRKSGNNSALINASNFVYNSQLFNECGKNLKWIIDETGVLTISGNGEMTNYDNPESVPWNSSREDIKSVVFDGEVTNIGNYVFWNCTNIEEINICPFRIPYLISPDNIIIISF